MVLKKLLLLIIGVTLIAAACKRPSTTKNVNEATVATYKDDLNKFRPTYKIEETTSTSVSTPEKPSKPVASAGPSGDITQKLDVALDTIAVRNRNIRFAQGYRIQIYSGGSREEANRARDRSYALIKDAIPHIVYTQPTFRVKVGDFMDRLEAQRVYAILLTEFPNALIMPDRIEIR
jgi:hypothetical protein